MWPLLHVLASPSALDAAGPEVPEAVAAVVRAAVADLR